MIGHADSTDDRSVMLSTCAGTGHCHFCILAAAAPWQAHGTGHKLNYRRKCGDSRCWDGTIIFFKENFGVFGDQWDGTTGETTPPWDGTSPNLWIYYGTEQTPTKAITTCDYADCSNCNVLKVARYSALSSRISDTDDTCLSARLRTINAAPNALHIAGSDATGVVSMLAVQHAGEFVGARDQPAQHTTTAQWPRLWHLCTAGLQVGQPAGWRPASCVAFSSFPSSRLCPTTPLPALPDSSFAGFVRQLSLTAPLPALSDSCSLTASLPALNASSFPFILQGQSLRVTQPQNPLCCYRPSTFAFSW